MKTPKQYVLFLLLLSLLQIAYLKSLNVQISEFSKKTIKYTYFDFCIAMRQLDAKNEKNYRSFKETIGDETRTDGNKTSRSGRIVSSESVNNNYAERLDFLLLLAIEDLLVIYCNGQPL